jgi:hypothetical protein
MKAIKTMRINGNFYHYEVGDVPSRCFQSVGALREYLLKVGCEQFGTEGRDFRIASSPYRNALIPIYLTSKMGDTVEIR